MALFTRSLHGLMLLAAGILIFGFGGRAETVGWLLFTLFFVAPGTRPSPLAAVRQAFVKPS